MGIELAEVLLLGSSQTRHGTGVMPLDLAIGHDLEQLAQKRAAGPKIPTVFGRAWPAQGGLWWARRGKLDAIKT
jgi:hypothetical protein